MIGTDSGMHINVSYFFSFFFRFMYVRSVSGIGSATSRAPAEKMSRMDPAMCVFGFFLGGGVFIHV